MNTYGHMNRLIDRRAYSIGVGPTVYGTIVGIWTGNNGQPEVVLETEIDHGLVRIRLDDLKLLPATEITLRPRVYPSPSRAKKKAGVQDAAANCGISRSPFGPDELDDE